MGYYWLLIILFPLIVNGIALFIATLWRAKDAAETYIAKRKYNRIRKELIASGKLKVIPALTAKEIHK